MNPAPPKQAALQRSTRWLKGGEWVDYRIYYYYYYYYWPSCCCRAYRGLVRNGMARWWRSGSSVHHPNQVPPLDLGSCSTRPYSTGYSDGLPIVSTHYNDLTRGRRSGGAKNMQGLPVGEPSSSQTGCLAKVYPLVTEVITPIWVSSMLAPPHSKATPADWGLVVVSDKQVPAGR